ncbi:hypothetical protein D3C80_1143850 [compost metagenome]
MIPLAHLGGQGDVDSLLHRLGGANFQLRRHEAEALGAVGHVAQHHGGLGHGVVVEGDGVVETAFQRPDLGPPTVRILGVQQIVDAPDDAGAPGVALTSGRLGRDLGQIAHLGPGRVVVERADKGPEPVGRGVEIGRVLLHRLGVVGETLTRQTLEAAILVLAPAARRGLEADHGVGHGAGLGRAIPGGRTIQRHVRAVAANGQGRGRRDGAGRQFGGQGGAIGQMLGLRAGQVVGPGAALGVRQGADPVDGQADRRSVGANDLGPRGADAGRRGDGQGEKREGEGVSHWMRFPTAFDLGVDFTMSDNILHNGTDSKSRLVDATAHFASDALDPADEPSPSARSDLRRLRRVLPRDPAESARTGQADGRTVRLLRRRSRLLGP